MKKLSLFVCALLLAGTAAHAQSFHKGSFLISLSEGGSFAHYSTSGIASDGSTATNMHGDRDPLTIEYGLSNRWGIGLNMGKDVYRPSASMYGLKTTDGRVQALVSEVTIDGNYHYLTTRHTDLSAFVSFGPSSVSFKTQGGDPTYNYVAGGFIVRAGSRAKFYIGRRIGIMAMVSTYSTSCSTKGQKGNTLPGISTTSLSGYAFEFGPCLRFGR